LNKISNSIQIGQSKICLEIGCITTTHADIIVNSTSRDLQLNCGSLSKVILHAAGNTIQQEAHLMYPNGIKVDQVAMTQAGLLKRVKFIFHTTSPHFVDNATCSQVDKYQLSYI
jgi:O-acetyl-ADP-ribose deacetylase (regulator of RNase III)